MTITDKKPDSSPKNDVATTTSALISDTDAYKELVSYAPVCIHEIGLDGCLKRMNKAGLDMMGLSFEEEVVDIPYTNFVGDHNQAWIRALMQKAIDGEPIPNFDFIIGSGDQVRSFSSNFIPMLDEKGDVVKIMGVSRETTTEYRAKLALEQLNHELEDRVKQATQELRAMVEELTLRQEQLVESRKMAALAGLLAGVSHEINTPLGIGITAVSVLKKATLDLMQAVNEQKVSRKRIDDFFTEALNSEQLIASSLNRTANLIKSFKQIAVDQSVENMRSFQIKQYVNNVLSSLRHELEKAPFVITFDNTNDFEVYGNPGAFSQIVSNLVMNSLHHGFVDREEGEITIIIELYQDTVEFCYKDSGCGISDAHKALIYEPFFTTKRGQGYTGLGLHIVYNSVTQSLNGTIDCKSTTENGTRFDIHFPRIRS